MLGIVIVSLLVTPMTVGFVDTLVHGPVTFGAEYKAYLTQFVVQVKVIAFPDSDFQRVG